jgi:hypothetical protein
MRIDRASAHLRFQVFTGTDGYSVRLTVDQESATAPFQFDLRQESRVSRVISDLADGIAVYDDLRDVGSQLYLSLVPGSVGELFARARDAMEQEAAAEAPTQIVLRLAVPPALQHLPWECLYDEERTGFLLTNPAFSVVRDAPVVAPQPRVSPRKPPVSLVPAANSVLVASVDVAAVR